jgi:hypothetical protein
VVVFYGKCLSQYIKFVTCCADNLIWYKFDKFAMLNEKYAYFQNHLVWNHLDILPNIRAEIKHHSRAQFEESFHPLALELDPLKYYMNIF